MLADMERFKHQVSGGWWKPDDEDEWTQAVREYATFLLGISNFNAVSGGHHRIY
jgi:hypothetical protein